MQENEMEESARGNISNKKDFIFIIAGTLKKEVCPTKEADPKV